MSLVRRSIRRSLASVMVLAAILSATAVAVVPTPAGADLSPDGDAAISMINDLRVSEGLAPLAWDSALQAIADQWAGELAREGFLGHNPYLADQMGDWWAWGENVGWGPSPQLVENAFEASRRHHANLVDPAYTSVGVGVAYAYGGGLYLVEVFGG